MRYDPTAPHPHPRRRPVTARLRLAAAALLLAALPASWADGRTRAPTAPVAVGLPHIVPVTGGSNFRDIGGYPTVDGKRVRFGLVFRSASTDYLTAADIPASSSASVSVCSTTCATRLNGVRTGQTASRSHPS